MEPILQDLALLLAQEALKTVGHALQWEWAKCAVDSKINGKKLANGMLYVLSLLRERKGNAYFEPREVHLQSIARRFQAFVSYIFTLIYHHHDIYNKAEVPGALVVHRELFYTLLPGCKKTGFEGPEC